MKHSITTLQPAPGPILWKVVASCGIAMFWSVSARAVYYAMLPVLRTELRLDTGIVLAAGTIMTILYVISNASVGYLPWPGRATIVYSMIGSAVVLAGLGLVRSPAGLLVNAAVFGLLVGQYPPRLVTAIANVSPPHLRGRAIGFHEVAAGSGSALGPLFAGLAIAAYNWPVVTLYWALLAGTIATMLVYIWFPKTPDPTLSKTPMGKSARLPFNLRLLALMAASAANFAIAMGFMSNLPLLLHLGWGVPEAEAAAFTGIVRFGGMVGGVGGGFLADRLGARRLLIALYTIDGILLMSMLYTPYGKAFGVLITLLGTLASAATVGFFTVVSESYRADQRQQAVGLTSAAGVLVGIALFPILLGYLAEFDMMNGVFWTTVAAAGVGVLSVAGLKFLRPTQAGRVP